EIFETLVAETASAAPVIAEMAGALAALDVATSLADMAEDRGYVRPVVDHSLRFDIEGGRHPVVEQALKSS
ncbi:MAG TPA: hypothetical protein PLO23_11085, partial [Alphaproteobacteria bacterium]|nr:hypothetical protein [Alphaproteobacteria bacterium]